MFCRSRLFLLAVRLFAQQPQANYDEAKVPIYTLPDPLTLKNGVVVKDAKTWSAKRRPEILAIYETEVFGQAPARPSKPNYELVSVDQNALSGKTERKQITVYFGRKDDPHMNLLVYLPAKTQKPAPVFLGLSFDGAHTITNDPSVPLTDVWVRDAATKQ